MTEETHGHLYPAKRLEVFGASALTALGFPEQDAALCAVRMIDADLRGVDTHGIFRLNDYSQRIKAGGINVHPQVHTVRENAVTALVDGDNGMRHVVMNFATELAIRKAVESGLAWIGTFKGNHAGAGAVYFRLCPAA